MFRTEKIREKSSNGHVIEVLSGAIETIEYINKRKSVLKYLLEC